MSASSGSWEFSYKDPDVLMSDDDLDQYQIKLLDIRENYKDKVAKLDGCSFYTSSLPPEDNIFARFQYECKRHQPHCSGWCLLWNPNINLNKDKLKSSLNNHCSLWQFKSTLKRIQQELLENAAVAKYFHFFDDDDTHEYYIDSFLDMMYGFKTNDDDNLPMYASLKYEEPTTFLHSLSTPGGEATTHRGDQHQSHHHDHVSSNLPPGHSL